jgi:hypothetical protein
MDATEATANMKSSQVKEGSMHSVTLVRALKMGLLPTPTSVQRDHPERVKELKQTGAKTIHSRNKGEERPNSIIDYLMFHSILPTPTESDFKGGRSDQKPREGHNPMTNNLRDSISFLDKTGKSSQLSPQFVMEMMGFPADWTELPFLNGEKKA